MVHTHPTPSPHQALPLHRVHLFSFGPPSNGDVAGALRSKEGSNRARDPRGPILAFEAEKTYLQPGLSLCGSYCSSMSKAEAKAQDTPVTLASKPQMTGHSWQKKPHSRHFVPHQMNPKIPAFTLCLNRRFPSFLSKQTGREFQTDYKELCMVCDPYPSCLHCPDSRSSWKASMSVCPFPSFFAYVRL